LTFIIFKKTFFYAHNFLSKAIISLDLMIANEAEQADRQKE